MSLRRDTVFVLLALVWLVVAIGAAVDDWPTPAKLSAERLQMAYLWANAVNKDFRPYDQPAAADPDARYQDLVTEYTARFGDQFNIAFVAKHYAAARANMPHERIAIIAFTLAATGGIWWLLFIIRKLLGPGNRNG